MPQLDPSPWLMMMMSSWLVLLIILAPKMMSFKFTDGPLPQNTHITQVHPWTWP